MDKKSPATCVYIIDQLIKEYRANETDNILKKYELHILPLLNPDGYEYSQTTYRLWRKNRLPNVGWANCPGVDLNRNYNYLYYWNVIPVIAKMWYKFPKESLKTLILF